MIRKWDIAVYDERSLAKTHLENCSALGWTVFSVTPYIVPALPNMEEPHNEIRYCVVSFIDKGE